MPRRVIDLSQPLSPTTQVHPFFTSPRIVREMIHLDYAEDQPSFNAELIITSNHAATHVDAFGHYDRTPGAAAIAEMPLDTFCGPAVCIDVREYGGKGHLVTPDEVEDALGKSGAELQEDDILLFCTDHYNQTAGTPAFLDGFSGVAPETVAWMAQRAVKIFGVETISPTSSTSTTTPAPTEPAPSTASRTTRTSTTWPRWPAGAWTSTGSRSGSRWRTDHPCGRSGSSRIRRCTS